MGRLDNQQTATSTTRGRLPKAEPTTIQPTPQSTGPGNFITNAPSNIGMLFRGEIKAGDVARNVPGVVKRGAVKTAETVTPAITNFVKTTGGIIGEGAAYAIDPNVRKQYRAGNLDILPNVTKTTGKSLVRDTAAAALETAIIRGIPGGLGANVKMRASIGGLEGIGFAITEGIAKDQSVDEILDNAVLYGVSGSALNTALPWLGPLLRKEIGRAPRTLVKALKDEAQTGVSAINKTIAPEDEATSVISYINKDDEKVYTTLTKDELEALRDEVKMIPEPGAKESQIHLDAKTPTLESQGKFVSRDEFVAGHSQAGDVLKKATPEVPQPKQASPSAVIPESTGPNTVAVQGEQIPIGGPTQGASRLEARLVAQVEDPAYQAGVSNYSRYSKAADAPEITGSSNAEQIKRASEAVSNLTPNQINDIVSGTAELPPGVLRTAFIRAATEQAVLAGDSALVNRLGRVVGQAARRFGQEIQFTKNFDPLDPVTNIADILSVRLKAAERRLTNGETATSHIRKNVKKAKEITSEGQLKIAQAESLIDSILC